MQSSHRTFLVTITFMANRTETRFDGFGLRVDGLIFFLGLLFLLFFGGQSSATSGSIKSKEKNNTLNYQ